MADAFAAARKLAGKFIDEQIGLLFDLEALLTQAGNDQLWQPVERAVRRVECGRADHSTRHVKLYEMVYEALPTEQHRRALKDLDDLTGANEAVVRQAAFLAGVELGRRLGRGL